MGMECKCYGVFGLCIMRICWIILLLFCKIGDYLFRKYKKVKLVVFMVGGWNRCLVYLILKCFKENYTKLW